MLCVIYSDHIISKFCLINHHNSLQFESVKVNINHYTTLCGVDGVFSFPTIIIFI